MGWWQRLTGRAAAPAPEDNVSASGPPASGRPASGPPESEVSPQPISEAEVRAYAQGLIHPRFTALDLTLEQPGDYYCDTPGAPDAATVERLIRAVWQERQLEQRSWPEHPDSDRSLMLAAKAVDDPDLQARAKAQHERIETAVGAQIVEALTRHGLEVSWGGTNSSRPEVAIREWRKRLPV